MSTAGSLRTRGFALLLASVGAAPALAQSTGGLGPYTLEIAPSIGINLPDDFWGAGVLKTVGAQVAWSFLPSHALVGGAVYHSGPNDSGYTGELLYRYESNLQELSTFFVIGFHVTKFSLGIDYDATGACDPVNCETDSGIHHGINIGGGMMIPLSPTTPFKVGMRFLKKQPKLMLLLDASIGIRF